MCNRHKISALQLALLQHLKTTGKPATLDDVTANLREKFPMFAPWRGSAVLGLQREGLIVRVDFVPSRRPSRHGNMTSRWKLVSVRDATAKIQELSTQKPAAGC